ncbi:very short patch repair endonuclease [Mucilaginibacter ginsenosidivorans]|uniref:Very short patch repair endonuclease n=1 Tax=Mucilaginibacter ginsenosidivorans TaxID=398053 RepID=A0A5B8USM8_9SPHI|nr:very short patch repair endonuclease [Mucilaginibacter ginsenosidivorans]QEC61715.1 very short patch repair endonuclease [Mucilaginibacter ginsenosidivorans]
MSESNPYEIIKGPRFKASNGFETTPQRSALMSKIRSTNSVAELLLRKALWSQGIRYRKNVPTFPGKPDILIRKNRLAIFIDGEFWHGYDWDNKKQKLKTNRDFWIPKIERNMQRDKSHNKILETMGYTVLRFWEKDVKRNTERCVNDILKLINQ